MSHTYNGEVVPEHDSPDLCVVLRAIEDAVRLIDTMHSGKPLLSADVKRLEEIRALVKL